MSGFRLAGILRIRGIQQQQAAGDLAQANHSLARVVQRRADIRAQLAGTTTDAAGPGAIAAMSSTRAAAQSMLADLTAMHASAEVTADDASAAYNLSRARTLALEKLQERHDRQQTAAREAQEQAALDELAVTRFQHRPGGNRP
ncbi:flagellar FliJ family protein [Curtobacterium citreum]